MKTLLPIRIAILAISTSILAGLPGFVSAQSDTDVIEVVRSSLKADRKVVLAEAMQFTESESQAFWPLYREYRAEVEKVADGLVKLVLEYADAYPGPLGEKRAGEMLKEYTALEEKLAALRTKYSKRLSKVLPASKVIRFLQVENRLDLVLRLELASAIPLVPEAAGANPPR
jgi:hypothetical protein